MDACDLVTLPPSRFPSRQLRRGATRRIRLALSRSSGIAFTPETLERPLDVLGHAAAGAHGRHPAGC